MDISVLKNQIGKNILNSIDEVREEENTLTLINGERKAEITLNIMDYYDIALSNGKIKQNIPFSKLREVLNKFFSFSLNQAIENNDKERKGEIEEKARNGEKVRIM